MPSGPSSSAGSVVALWRYPVKSMLGEELSATEVTRRGLVGDRQFAVIDRVTGKVAGAKNPRKWGNFFEFQAAYTETPHPVLEAPGGPPDPSGWLADDQRAARPRPQALAGARP